MQHEDGVDIHSAFERAIFSRQRRVLGERAARPSGSHGLTLRGRGLPGGRELRQEDAVDNPDEAVLGPDALAGHRGLVDTGATPIVGEEQPCPCTLRISRGISA